LPVLAVLALGLTLSACATAPRAVPGASLAPRPLAAPADAGERSVNQVVRGAFGARETVLSCVISVKDGVMSVVGLNALGVRLFTIRFDGQQVQAEKSFAVPDAISPERLLADLQLVYWPLSSLQQTLKPAGLEVSESAPGTRRLRRGDRLVAEVHYAAGGASVDGRDDAWSGRAWLVNLEFGYSLQIDSGPP
jgi:hypothetical protein